MSEEGKRVGVQRAMANDIWLSRESHDGPGEQGQSLQVFLIWEVPSTQQVLKKKKNLLIE